MQSAIENTNATDRFRLTVEKVSASKTRLRIGSVTLTFDPTAESHTDPEEGLSGSYRATFQRDALSKVSDVRILRFNVHGDPLIPSSIARVVGEATEWSRMSGDDTDTDTTIQTDDIDSVIAFVSALVGRGIETEVSIDGSGLWTCHDVVHVLRDFPLNDGDDPTGTSEDYVEMVGPDADAEHSAYVLGGRLALSAGVPLHVVVEETSAVRRDFIDRFHVASDYFTAVRDILERVTINDVSVPTID